jgi:hypothetical protein
VKQVLQSVSNGHLLAVDVSKRAPNGCNRTPLGAPGSLNEHQPKVMIL